MSSSLDGTVRAYDLLKYRNFRVLHPPNKNTQITCITVTSGGAVGNVGDLVCGGSSDNFDIYVWNLKNGQILDVLNGHTAPISNLSFNSTGVTFSLNHVDIAGECFMGHDCKSMGYFQ